MSNLSSEEEHAADRLGFHLLRDAFCNFAEMARQVSPADAERMIAVIEDRLVLTLTRRYLEKTEGEHSNKVVSVVGQRLSAVLDDARDLSGRGQFSEVSKLPVVD